MATRYNHPFRSFEGFAKKMNSLAREMEQGVTIEKGDFSPRVDITEDKKNVHISVELPGLSKENVSIAVNEENILTVKGSKSREKVSEGKTFYRTERFFGDFSRSFLLPDTADRESITAKFENGVLEVEIAKKEPEKPKTTNIEIS